jgi:prolyl oligopeptidase PreP (S9A serine peptidase family)
MAISQELRKALEETTLTYEELRAFEAGLMLLTPEEQQEFLAIVTEDPELVYPLYINFKAKLHAAQAGEGEWQDAVERELLELEEFMKRRRVGNEIV